MPRMSWRWPRCRRKPWNTCRKGDCLTDEHRKKPLRLGGVLYGERTVPQGIPSPCPHRSVCGCLKIYFSAPHRNLSACKQADLLILRFLSGGCPPRRKIIWRRSWRWPRCRRKPLPARFLACPLLNLDLRSFSFRLPTDNSRAREMQFPSFQGRKDTGRNTGWVFGEKWSGRFPQPVWRVSETDLLGEHIGIWKERELFFFQNRIKNTFFIKELYPVAVKIAHVIW